jgi:energy-coupling factor transporter ATP-binding protein EcfA2
MIRMTMDKQNEILLQMSSLRQTSQNYSNEQLHQVALQSGIVYSVSDFLTERLEDCEKKHSRLLRALTRAIHAGHGIIDNTTADQIQMSEERRQRLQKEFISLLSYAEMHDREYHIREAHKDTFTWVFKDQPSSPDFKKWLQSDGQVYWITGKAGSGKSTLMRYISQVPGGDTRRHPRCEKYLRKWAGDQIPLVMATFFFWAAGSQMQTSPVGLFRTLLCQLLAACPEVIPIVSPRRWEVLAMLNHDDRQFKHEELVEMLHQTIAQISKSSKLILFVDGLDEFDGDPHILIDLLNNLKSKFQFKLCVASRPWPEFETAFQRQPSLKLEDLTRSDVTKYVKAKLQESKRFTSLQQTENTLSEALIKSIVDKACGVFLWVSLVVASLLAGLENGDRIEDLDKRLALLPTDLEKLYDRIIEQIDPSYLEHASQYFQLMKASISPPLLLIFSFADEVYFADKSLNSELKSYSQAQIESRLEDMRLRLNSRCKGLLEVNSVADYPSDFKNYTVQYLHKTVRDYILREDVQVRLNKSSKTEYDPNIRLLAGNIAVLKFRNNARESWRARFKTIEECLKYASITRSCHHKDLLRLLADLRVTYKSLSTKLELSQRWNLDPSPIDDVEYMRRWFSKGEVASIQLNSKDEFLCFVVKSTVVEYVKHETQRGCLIAQPEPLYRLGPIFELSLSERIRGARLTNNYPLLFFLDYSNPLCPSMLQALISRGADVNLQYYDCKMPSSSPWERLIARILLFASPKNAIENDILLKNISDCTRMMIGHGAIVRRASVYRAYRLFTYVMSPNTESHDLRKLARDGVIVDAVYLRLKDMKKDQSLELTSDFYDKVHLKVGPGFDEKVDAKSVRILYKLFRHIAWDISRSYRGGLS